MKIAIIGAGFTGLTSTYKLLKKGYNVTIFEKDEKPGGLAVGFRDKNWRYSLEKYYHHIFTNDHSALNLAREIGQKIITKKPKTSVYVDKKIYQLDTPLTIITFPRLSILERLRMGAVLGVLRFNPFWKPFEKITAHKFLSKLMGKKAYEIIWESLLVGKFGNFSKEISLAWFWARVKKRTTKLSYPEGGFLEFANLLTQKIKDKKGKIYFNTEAIEIKEESGKVKILYRDKQKTKEEIFDKVIVTVPSFLFLKICKNLPAEYRQKLKNLKSLGAINLVLRLKKPFFNDNTYWLSICDKSSDILAIVEHTNLIDKIHYNNEHIVYVGKYLPSDHPFFLKSDKEMLAILDPYLKEINEKYKNNLIDYHFFKSAFAQPVIPANYSKIMPPFETPLKNVYLANIEQVYPWDRGTNYAIELGEKIAKVLMKK